MSIDIVPYAFDDYKAPVLLRKYRCIRYETEIVRMTDAEAKEKAQAAWEAFLADWETQGVQIIQAELSTEIIGKVCIATGTVTACGNFISYQEILEEEWIIQDEHSRDNP